MLFEFCAALNNVPWDCFASVWTFTISLLQVHFHKSFSACLMAAVDLNSLLMDAVSRFDVPEVQNLLNRGADVNYHGPLPEGGVQDDRIQPTTPLKMVMFRISDCMLSEADLGRFGEIAQILIRHGADTAPAMEIAEARYGTYQRNGGSSRFDDVWDIVAEAHTTATSS